MKKKPFSETEGGGSETEEGFWKQKAVETNRKTVFGNRKRWKQNGRRFSETESGGNKTEDGFWKRKAVEQNGRRFLETESGGNETEISNCY